MTPPDQPRPSRRHFLQAGAAAPLALGLPAQAQSAHPGTSCILLLLVGGPSQLDTFDPKPDAPTAVRGPFKPIATRVPGTHLSELFPLTAAHAGKFSLVRSVHHHAAATHATGCQLVQSGRTSSGGVEHPSMGSAVGFLRGGRNDLPAHVLLPGPVGETGGHQPHGHGAGFLGQRFDPLVPAAVSHGLPATFDVRREPAALRDRYGRTRFGQSCLQARRLVEAGVRFVTVPMADTVFGRPTWDVHGTAPFSDFRQMADVVAPTFDRAYSALLEDLHQRGLLGNTIVLASGEFGRTPKVNAAGGRDHHPGVWTVLVGGGPVRGGRVVGASDDIGYAPKSRPVTSAEVAATVYAGLGLDPHAALPGPHGRPVPLVDPGVRPIAELF